jgi:hypothetical protein
LDDGFVVNERSATPVLGDVAEESVFDLVPLGCARRKVRNPDREPGSISETLELDLPQTTAGPVAPAAISRDE